MPSSRMSSALTAGLAALVPLVLAGQEPPKPPMDRMDKATAKMSMVKAKGDFTGTVGHQAAGSYTITEVSGKFVLGLSEDFSVDREAPDVYVVLSAGATVGKDMAVWLGKIKSYTGAQQFEIPVGLPLAGLTTVVLWCKKYSVSLGTAGLDPAGLMPEKMAKMKDAMKPDPTRNPDATQDRR